MSDYQSVESVTPMLMGAKIIEVSFNHLVVILNGHKNKVSFYYCYTCEDTHIRVEPVVETYH